MFQEHDDSLSPPYVKFFESLLVEELVLEPNYLKLHYGKCAVIGRLTVLSGTYRLENVRLRSLPGEYSLPSGILSLLLLGLDFAKANQLNLTSGCYCIVRGEVVLCSLQAPNSPTLTTGGVVNLLKGMTDDEAARKRYLEELHLTHIPAVDVWFAQPIDLVEELLDRKLQLFEAEHTDGAARDLSCNWKGIKEASWQDFWLREGPPLLEEKWNKRFPEYKAIEAGEDCDEAEKRHWLDLWEEHVKDLVNRIWHIFSCAFENYQQELLKSFAPITAEDLDEVDEELEQLDISETQPESKHNQKNDVFAEDGPYLSGNQDPEYISEKKQRKLQSSSYDDPEDIEEAKLRELLGLPVSFGAQPKRRQPRVEQNSSNYDNAEDFEEEEVERKPKGLPACNNSTAKEWFEQDFYSLANWDMTSDEEQETEAEALHAVLNGFIKKKKPKKKKKKTSRLEDQMPDFIKENKGKLFKYWLKRFSLFSRFDQGIRLDRESWFSVTPEKIAKQTARRLACDVILDAFCGCGGNAIQFALTCARVIAVDIDAEKLAMAKHNARIYGVADKIEFIHADFLQFAVSTNLRPDVVFFSPPWGGPNYTKQATFDIERSLLPVSASLLMGLGRRLADNVGFFLPRNTSISQVIALSGVGQQCEVEHNFLDTRLVALTAYFGTGLIKKK